MNEWHHINTFYGYKLYVPEEYKYQEFINLLDGLNSIIKEPFQFTAIISSLYMDNSLNEPFILDSISDIIIGFNTLNTTLDMIKTFADELDEYVIDNSILKGIEHYKDAQFYSGIGCFGAISESDSDNYSRDSREDSRGDSSEDSHGDSHEYSRGDSHDSSVYDSDK